MSDFEKELHDMFGYILDSEIENPVFRDIVVGQMQEAFQANKIAKAESEDKEGVSDGRVEAMSVLR